MNDPGASCRGIEYKMQQTHKNTNSHPAAELRGIRSIKKLIILSVAVLVISAAANAQTDEAAIRNNEVAIKSDLTTLNIKLCNNTFIAKLF